MIEAMIPGRPRSWQRSLPVIRWRRRKPGESYPRGTPAAVMACGLVPFAVPIRAESKPSKTDPETQDQYKHRAAMLIRVAAGRTRLSGPVAVGLTFVYARPGSCPKGVPRDAWKTGRRLYRPTAQGSDLDRLQGLILDALTDSRVIVDDGALCQVVASKWYAADGEAPT